ncbi:MAG: hypothetical protein ACXAE3_00610 [Candidatus Kariarchaeaceae archaeon]|jgi:CO dehydrogenase/acetyl-CoA synthase alpha subunit
MVDRSGYSDVMVAFENMIGEKIIEEAQRMGLKKIETYMVIENVLAIMKEEIRKERRI